MPNQMPGQPKAETAQPRGWILCGLYILLTAALGAASVLALDLLWTFLASSATIDRDSFVIHVLTMLLSMAAVTVTFMVGFFFFRRVFHLRPLSLTDERVNAFKTACLVIVAYFVFLLVYLLISRQAGITKGELEPDFLGALFAYVFYAKWPIWNLLNPAGSPPCGPNEAAEPQR